MTRSGFEQLSDRAPLGCSNICHFCLDPPVFLTRRVKACCRHCVRAMRRLLSRAATAVFRLTQTAAPRRPRLLAATASVLGASASACYFVSARRSGRDGALSMLPFLSSSPFMHTALASTDTVASQSSNASTAPEFDFVTPEELERYKRRVFWSAYVTPQSEQSQSRKKSSGPVTVRFGPQDDVAPYIEHTLLKPTAEQKDVATVMEV